MNDDDSSKEKAKALAAPFPADHVRWKPGATSGGRAMALAYIDARMVMNRLDKVVGLVNWQDAYETLPDGSVLCKLSVRLGGEWITKCDVGGQSGQPDEGDRDKAAHSEALKRAAVKFGVGRYLYFLPQQWCDYDGQKKHFTKTPTLPDWAKPQPAVQAQKALPAPPAEKRSQGVEVSPVSEPAPAFSPARQAAAQQATAGTPGLSDEQQSQLKAALIARGLEPALTKQLGEWLCGEYHVSRLGLLDPIHLGDAVQKVKTWQPPATEADRAELDTLAGQLGWDADRLHDEFRRVGCPHPDKLTHAQARKVVLELESLVGTEVPA